MGVPLKGVPLGTYNFGGSIGVQSTDSTDTIVQRLGVATSPSTTIPIQLDALQLETEGKTTFGGLGPLDYYFITLGRTPSLGTMTIDFSTPTSGTFTSFFDVFFDIHIDSLTGPVVDSGSLSLDNSGSSWSTTAPPGAELIGSVDYFLDGNDTNNDFWPGVAGVTELHPGGGGEHEVVPTGVPEGGSTISLLLLGAGLCGLGRRWTKSRPILTRTS